MSDDLDRICRDLEAACDAESGLVVVFKEITIQLGHDTALATLHATGDEIVVLDPTICVESPGRYNFLSNIQFKLICDPDLRRRFFGYIEPGARISLSGYHDRPSHERFARFCNLNEYQPSLVVRLHPVLEVRHVDIVVPQEVVR